MVLRFQIFHYELDLNCIEYVITSVTSTRIGRIGKKILNKHF
jgi:hypothetical protein